MIKITLNYKKIIIAIKNKRVIAFFDQEEEINDSTNKSETIYYGCYYF